MNIDEIILTFFEIANLMVMLLPMVSSQIFAYLGKFLGFLIL